eukprot:EG_transcript_11314
MDDDDDYDVLTRSLQAGDNAWKELIESGIDINTRYGNGGVALIHSAARLKASAVESVLQAKADPNLEDNFCRTPLIHAAMSAPTAMLPLIAANCNVNHRAKDGANALQSLLERPYDLNEEPTVLICTRKLIAAKADVNQRSALGYSPLFFAAVNQPQCVTLLLDAGANPLLRNKYGDTARDEAAAKGAHPLVLEELFIAETDPKYVLQKFQQFGYIVLMLSASNLNTKTPIPCKNIPGPERVPKYQPYLLVIQRDRTIHKVNSVDGDSARPFFDRLDLHCKDYDVREPIELRIVANTTMHLDVLGSMFLNLERFLQSEKLDGTEFPLTIKGATPSYCPRIRVHASRLRYVHEPYEKANPT